MRDYQRFVLSVPCSVCGSAGGRWCRDADGKAVTPHSERLRAAIGISCGLIVPEKSIPGRTTSNRK